MLRDGAVIANLARGGIIDEADLVAELARDRLRGALLDVFSKEPLAADHPLRTTPHVVLTPHLGASTAEGQRNVSVDVCASVRDALLSGELSSARQRRRRRTRAIGTSCATRSCSRAARRRWLARCSPIAVRAPSISSRSASAASSCTPTRCCCPAAAIGVVEGVVEGTRLNVVNARAQAEARGIALAVAPAIALGPAVPACRSPCAAMATR